MIKKTGQIIASSHRQAVLLLEAMKTSLLIKLQKSLTESFSKVYLRTSSAQIRKAQVFCGNVFPWSILSTARNAALNISDKPVLAINVPMHPTENIKK